MPTPRRFGQTGVPLVAPPAFKPGATAKVAKIDYSLVRTRGTTTSLTHAIAGHPKSRYDILGEHTLCGARISQNGTLLDYKRPGGPGCKACAKAVFRPTQEV